MTDDSPIVLATFKTQSHARVLADYLRSQSIHSDVVFNDESEYSHIVVIQDVGQVNDAKVILEDFLHNPHQAKFQQAAWQLGTSIESTGTGLGNLNVSGALKRAPLTWAVLLTAALIFLQAQIMGLTGLFHALHFMPVADALSSGEVWRWVSPILLHFSVTHVVFNLFWWGLLGQRVERVLGRPWLLLLLLSSAFLSNYAQFWLTGPNFGGLSGVVYALMGFVWWCGWLKPSLGLSLDRPLVGFMLIWLVLGYTDLLWINVANGAHTIGLVVGCALAGLYCRVINPDRGTL